MVGAVHAVHCDVLCCMHYMNIAIDILGAFPLEDIEARSGREEHGGIEHVELGICLVAYANVLALDVLIALLENGIVLRTGEIYGLLLLLFELV